MKSVEWWRTTANHMWRTFFALERDGFIWNELSPSDQKIYAVCHCIFTHSFVKSDQDILRSYFTSRWGDDLYAVEDYSLKNNIPVKVIWMVIRKANRRVMEDLGLLERKEGSDAGKETGND